MSAESTSANAIQTENITAADEASVTMSDYENLINHWQKSLSVQQLVDRKPGNHANMHPLIIGQLNYMALTKELSFEAADLLIRSHLKEHENNVDKISNTFNAEFDYAECALKFAGCQKQSSKFWKSNLNATTLLKESGKTKIPNQVLISDEVDIDLLLKHFPAVLPASTQHANKEVLPILPETAFLEGENKTLPISNSRTFKRHLTSPDSETSPKKTNVVLENCHPALRQQLFNEMQMSSQNATSDDKVSKGDETKKRREVLKVDETKHCGEIVTFKTAKQQYLKDQQKRIGQPNSRSLFLTKNRPAHLFSKPSKLPSKSVSDNNAKNETCSDDKMKHIDPKMIELMMSEIMDHGPPINWDDIAGLEFAKKTIKEIVIWPMLRPDLFIGLRGPPKGVLLFGPPGTGKTLIGKCIASQTKSTFFSISASSLTSKWIGEGEKLVKTLFTVARCHQPAVIFIDEIDSLLTQRSESEHESSRRIKTEFLVQLDGATTSSNERLLVVGATNRPQELDEALRRRLVKRLYIPLPELEARRQIVKTLLNNQSHSLNENDLDVICNNTNGYSGSDMANLCKEAALGPIRRLNFADIEHINEEEVEPIVLKDFTDALKQVRASVSQKDLQCYIEWNEKYGSTAVVET